MSMHRDKPPFRADHVGSLLRPPSLLAAREKARKGEMSAQDLRVLEDEAIVEVVKLQEEHRPQVRHRRRIPAHALARRFPALVRKRRRR